jgi:hypothetical protein
MVYKAMSHVTLLRMRKLFQLLHQLPEINGGYFPNIPNLIEVIAVTLRQGLHTCLHLRLSNSADIYQNEKYFEQNYRANTNIRLQLVIVSRRSRRFITEIYSDLWSLRSI